MAKIGRNSSYVYVPQFLRDIRKECTHMKKRFLSIMMALCLALSLLPATAFAEGGDEAPVEVQPMEEPLVEKTAGPTASGVNFFANGTRITITDSKPEGATEASFNDSFKADGTAAFISWDDHGAKKYVGVSENVTVWGGGDGSDTAVSFPSTSITMTGGTVKKILGGNFGQKNTNQNGCSSVTGDVDISITGGSVTDLIYGGGENNTRVDGTVTITLNNVKLGGRCYVNGGVLGHGDEGTRNIEDGTMTTHAVVNKVVINATKSHAYVIGGGGSGSTKVRAAYVTLNGCTVDYLYTSGINGEMGYSSLRATGCKITQELAATNRGFVKTAEVTLEDCDVERLMTGATSGCFSSDSGYPDGSAITDSIVWNIDTKTEVEKAVLTPMVKRDGDSSNPVYTATTQNTTIKKDGDQLAVSIEEFKPSTKLSTTVTEVIIPEDSTLSLNNVKITVAENNTLTNVGTIDMDVNSSLTAGENSSFAQLGTVTGSGSLNIEGSGIKDNYVARVGSTGYTTLQAAIDAADRGDTVTLLKSFNVSLDGVGQTSGAIRINKNITLDGDGNTITATATDSGRGKAHIIVVGSSANVTIEDLNLDGSDQIARYGIQAYGEGTELTLDTVNSYDNYAYSFFANDAKVVATNVTTSGNGWGGVNVDNGGKLTVSSGTFNDEYSVVIEGTDNEATLNGGTYENIQVKTTGDQTNTLTITGGEYKDIVGDDKGGSPKANQTTVKGGTFKNSVKQFADDTVAYELNDSGTYSYHKSLEDALDAAKSDSATVTKIGETETPVTYYEVIVNYGNSQGTVTEYIKANTQYKLPSAPSSRPGYTFDGWLIYGNRYQPGATITIDGPKTIDADWNEVSSSGGSSSSEPSYSPVMDVSKGGSVKVNPRTPGEGDEVTITVDPDRGYEVGDVTVTDRSGRDVRVTAERDGTYTFEQPKGRVTIAVTFVREGTSTFFTDVAETYWAYDEIAWAYENGYVNGVTATTFAPGASISRQQIWMILARIAGDDPADMAAARQWSIDNGISDGTNPGSAVTRQQLAALLYRYAQMMGYANEARVDLSSFPDAGSVASYAVEPMQWSVANSIVGGTTDGTLNPTGTATRAQFAVMLYRFWTGV